MNRREKVVALLAIGAVPLSALSQQRGGFCCVGFLGDASQNATSTIPIK